MKICPICLQEKERFEKHHVIWRVNGGSNDPVNLLDICKTCHSIITWGDDEDRIPKDLTCLTYQIGTYGLTFFLKSNILSSKYHSSFNQFFLEKYANESAEEIDQYLKRAGMELYNDYVDSIRNT